MPNIAAPIGRHRLRWPVLAKSLPLCQVTFNILTVLLIFRCSRMQNILRTPNLTAPAGSEATIRAYVSRFQMDWRLRQADEVLYFEFLCTYVYLSVEEQVDYTFDTNVSCLS